MTAADPLAECNAHADRDHGTDRSADEHHRPDHRAAERCHSPGPGRALAPCRAVADRGVQTAPSSKGYALT